MKKKTFKLQMYNNAIVTIIWDKDLKWIENEFKTKSLDNYGAITLRDDDNFGKYYIAFEYNNDLSIVAHEIVHLLNYFYIDHGIELDRFNDETHAYFTGWLFRKISKFLTKQKSFDFDPKQSVSKGKTKKAKQKNKRKAGKGVIDENSHLLDN